MKVTPKKTKGMIMIEQMTYPKGSGIPKYIFIAWAIMEASIAKKMNVNEA
jgi:hypothetical protein